MPPNPSPLPHAPLRAWDEAAVPERDALRQASASPQAGPILITGATGTLGRAFARICLKRQLAFRLLGRAEMDIADLASVEKAMTRYRPWAVINASGYVRVDQAETDIARCFRENVQGPATLAAACARHSAHLTIFSSGLVFDGARLSPYTEADPVAPLNIYGCSKAAAERIVRDRHDSVLVVRSSSFFGPWDRHNFLTQVLDTLARGAPFTAASDLTVSPTYVPDLVQACLDLVFERACGIWHLTNGTALTWAELAHKAALRAGIDTSRLERQSAAQFRYQARRPRYSALGSARAMLLPSLDCAIDRYIDLRGG